MDVDTTYECKGCGERKYANENGIVIALKYYVISKVGLLDLFNTDLGR